MNYIKNIFQTHAELYVLDEPLEDKPDTSASYEDHMEWLEQRTTHLKVEWMMCTFMNSDLSRQFTDLSANEIVAELKNRFIAQVRIARFDGPNEFLSTKMEENSCLEQHLRKMHKMYYTLVDVWNYEMNDDFEIGRAHV